MPVYDAKGNMTTDPSGNGYGYDFNNRMISAMVGSNSAGFTYDALGRRVTKTVTVGAGTPTTTVYVSDGAQEIAEYASGAAPPHRRPSTSTPTTSTSQC